MPPRNVLPASPMKILDGYQFLFKNPINPRDSGRKKTFILIDRIINVNEKIPQIKPSIPSMKFTIFIRPLIKVTIPR